MILQKNQAAEITLKLLKLDRPQTRLFYVQCYIIYNPLIAFHTCSLLNLIYFMFHSLRMCLQTMMQEGDVMLKLQGLHLPQARLIYPQCKQYVRVDNMAHILAYFINFHLPRLLL